MEMWEDVFATRLVQGWPRGQIMAQMDAVDGALVQFLGDGNDARDPLAALNAALIGRMVPALCEALRAEFADVLGVMQTKWAGRYPPAERTRLGRAFLRGWVQDRLNALRSESEYPRALSWSETLPAEITHMCAAVMDGNTAWYKQIYAGRVAAGELERTLRHRTAGWRRYHHDANTQWKTTCHYGQRKLLMSEIEFLTLHAWPGDTVVYAGAAPGTHIPFLCRMFASLDLTYVLVDPAFPEEVVVPPCRKIRNLFQVEGTTENCASHWRGRNDVLFISDIRTNTSVDQQRPPSARDVELDMELQRRCVDRMRPRAGMLKFRLPWRPIMVPYIPGDIRLPVWGGQRTTECRLMFTQEAYDRGDFVYDAGLYEQEMYYFNTTTRVSRYQDLTVSCQCYDCAAESAILRAYVTRFNDWLRDTGLPRDVDVWRDRITAHTEQDPAMCANETHEHMVMHRRR